MPRVFAWNHHTPYWHMWRQNVPLEWELYLGGSSHAPSGWRNDQRPWPEGVTVVDGPDACNPDVVILQTSHDVARQRGSFAGGLFRHLFLAHNRAEFEWPAMVGWLIEGGIPLVAISEMKASSYRLAGYDHRLITVILPGIRVEDYPLWTGEGGYILTVANNLRRPLFDQDAWAAWVTQVEGSKQEGVRLVGDGNDGLPWSVGPAASWEALKREHRDAGVYLNPTRPPYEDGWNLAALEAAATGCPVVNLYPDGVTIWAGSGGVWPGERHDPRGQREAVRRVFSPEEFSRRWQRVLQEVCGG